MNITTGLIRSLTTKEWTLNHGLQQRAVRMLPQPLIGFGGKASVRMHPRLTHPLITLLAVVILAMFLISLRV
jgi:hypothetical protein